MDAADLHAQVERAFNKGDVDALVDLYDPGACMLGPDGSEAVGSESIRATWAGLVALGGRMTITTRYATEVGDISLLSNTWRFEAGDLVLNASTAEVARRQSDGSWRYVIDHPFGGSGTP